MFLCAVISVAVGLAVAKLIGGRNDSVVVIFLSFFVGLLGGASLISNVFGINSLLYSVGTFAVLFVLLTYLTRNIGRILKIPILLP